MRVSLMRYVVFCFYLQLFREFLQLLDDPVAFTKPVKKTLLPPQQQQQKQSKNANGETVVVLASSLAAAVRD